MRVRHLAAVPIVSLFFLLVPLWGEEESFVDIADILVSDEEPAETTSPPAAFPGEARPPQTPVPLLAPPPGAEPPDTEPSAVPPGTPPVASSLITAEGTTSGNQTVFFEVPDPTTGEVEPTPPENAPTDAPGDDAAGEVAPVAPADGSEDTGIADLGELLVTDPAEGPAPPAPEENRPAEKPAAAPGRKQPAEPMILDDDRTPTLARVPGAVLGVGGSVGDESLYGADLFLPLFPLMRPDGVTVFFLDPAIRVNTDETRSYAIGGGFRRLGWDGLGQGYPWIFGVNAFADFAESPRDYDYRQLGFGAEFLFPLFHLRGNGYIPIGTDTNVINRATQTSTSRESATRTSTTYGDPFASGYAVLQDVRVVRRTTVTDTTVTRFLFQEEAILGGGDIEAGVPLPFLQDSLSPWLYAGYFFFNSPGGDDVEGAKVRLNASPAPWFSIETGWYGDDRLTGASWYLGAEMRIPLWKQRLTRGWESSTFNSGKAFPSQLGAVEPTARTEMLPLLFLPVARLPQPVIIDTAFREEVARRQVNVNRSTSSSVSDRVDVIRDRLIFADNSRGANGAPGTWEAPVASIQEGANIAVAFGDSSGRIWTVWTQGGTGIAYAEEINVRGSALFTSSAIPIVAGGGKTFGGTGIGPVVDGGFFFGYPSFPGGPAIARAGIEGYIVTGGHSGLGFQGITLANVNSAQVLQSLVTTTGGSGIVASNITPGTYDTLVQGVEVRNAGGSGFFASGGTGTNSTAALRDSTITDTGAAGVRLETTGTAIYSLEVTGNSLSGSNDAAVLVETGIGSTSNATVNNNAIANAGNAFRVFAQGGFTTINANSNEATNLTDHGFNAIMVGDSRGDFTVTNSRFESVAGNTVRVLTEGDATVGLNLTGNFSANTGGSAVLLNAIDDSVIEPEIVNNQFAGGGSHGVEALASSGATIGALVSGNFIDGFLKSGIFVDATDNALIGLQGVGNVIRNTVEDGIRIQIRTLSSAALAIRNNTIGSIGNATSLRTIFSGGGSFDLQVTGNLFGPTAQSGMRVEMSDTIVGSTNIQNNIIRNPSQSAIDLILAGATSNRVNVQGNLLESVGNRGVSIIADGSKGVSIANNVINETGSSAVYLETTGAGFVLDGAAVGGNVYNDATPIPFTAVIAMPPVGGDGILINGSPFPP